MFTSHWDGYFNNYFIYHDTKGTGKWSLYPWDQDSTWSQRGGRAEDLYKMPLNFGSEGALPPGVEREQNNNENTNERRFGGFGGFGRSRGGYSYWRDGDAISKPLLGNPMFRKRFLARLRELMETQFTKDNLSPRINQIREEVGLEIKYREESLNTDSSATMQTFQQIIDDLHAHLKYRSAFLNEELNNPE